jgi:hypothetical protein
VIAISPKGSPDPTPLGSGFSTVPNPVVAWVETVPPVTPA